MAKLRDGKSRNFLNVTPANMISKVLYHSLVVACPKTASVKAFPAKQSLSWEDLWAPLLHYILYGSQCHPPILFILPFDGRDKRPRIHLHIVCLEWEIMGYREGHMATWFICYLWIKRLCDNGDVWNRLGVSHRYEDIVHDIELLQPRLRKISNACPIISNRESWVWRGHFDSQQSLERATLRCIDDIR